MTDVNVHAESAYGVAGAPSKAAVETLAGGSVGEIVGGGGAIILSIVALTGVMASTLTAVAVIALGVSLALEGGSIAATYRELLNRHSGISEELELGGGLTAESLGGLAGIALGVLALLGVATQMLLAIAALVLGAAVLLGAGVLARVNDLRMAERTEQARRIAREAVFAATGTQVLVGIAVMVLAIVAIQGIETLTLVAVGTLCLGVSMSFAGSALGNKLTNFLHY